ncbi:Protein Ycf2 [Bienertia sinuspersici]
MTLFLQPELRNPLDMMQKGSCSILDHRFIYRKYELEEREGALVPQQFGLQEFGTPAAFYLIISKGPMNWDFLIRPGHFRASGSFMIKRMSFKRMIRSSCRVESCSCKHEIDLPKNRAFFE